MDSPPVYILHLSVDLRKMVAKDFVYLLAGFEQSLRRPNRRSRMTMRMM